MNELLKKYQVPAVIGLVCVLFFFLPFNVAYHFNDTFAYIHGIFVNYADFVVHIVDVAVLGLLIGLLVFGRPWRDPCYLRFTAVLVVPWLIHNLIFRDLVVVYSSTRLFLYALCFGSAVFYFKQRDAIGRKMKGLWSAVLVAIVVATVIQAIIGIAQFVSNETVGIPMLGESIVRVGGFRSSSVSLPGGLNLRAYGTFPHPNILGGFLAISFLILLMSVKKVKGLMKWIVAISLCIVAAGIVVTWSRSAWTVAAFGSLMWFGVEMWNRGRRYFFGYLAGVVVLSGIFCTWVFVGSDSIAEAVRERFINQSTSSDVSVEDRGYLNDIAVEFIKEHPVFGVGAGKFVVTLVEEAPRTATHRPIAQPVHNIPLLVLSEVGIVGVLWILLLFVMISRQIGVSVELIILGLAICAIGLVDHYFWTLPQGIALFLLVIIWHMVYKKRMI